MFFSYMQEMWPESEELLQRMKSLQIDAVVVDTSNGQIGKCSKSLNQRSIYSAKDKGCPCTKRVMLPLSSYGETQLFSTSQRILITEKTKFAPKLTKFFQHLQFKPILFQPCAFLFHANSFFYTRFFSSQFTQLIFLPTLLVIPANLMLVLSASTPQTSLFPHSSLCYKPGHKIINKETTPQHSIL